MAVSAISACAAAVAEDKVLDEASGFIIDEGWELAHTHCATCHSARLVIQNRMDRNGWEDIIHLMQSEHGLRDLGADEAAIIDYLSRHYGPDKSVRRIRKGKLPQQR